MRATAPRADDVDGRVWIVAVCGLWLAISASAAAQTSPPNEGSVPRTPPARCRIGGRVTSGNIALPGVSIVLQRNDGAPVATSSDVDGTYSVVVPVSASYHLVAELTAFTRAERDVTLTASPCDATIDFELTLQPPREAVAAGAAPLASTAATPAQTETSRDQRGRASEAGQATARFQALDVQPDANATAATDASSESPADVGRLLPPGFSAQAAESDAVAFNGSADATSLDRGQLNDRLQAIRAGAFDPTSGQLSAVGPGRGGRADRGALIVGGRGARAQNPYQGSITYTFGGSALDTPPYQLRPDVPITQPQFTRHNFGATFGGPVKIPRLYENSNRRTNFQLNYTGSQSNNLFDQYATVPTDAMRRGDFSASGIRLVDPFTGQLFPANQIPASRIDPASATLVSFIPSANLPGTVQNYHVSTTSHASSDNFSARFTQNLSPVVGPGRGGPLGGARGARPTIMLSAQMQYRRSVTDGLNVFPGLGGVTTNTTIAAPISLNVVRNRVIQNFHVNVTHANAQSTNSFSGTTNVASLAGIQYPGASATDPLNWGPPNLIFSGFTGVRSAAASQRGDNRVTAGYMTLRPVGTHRLRFGGDYRYDTSTTDNNPNARGSFTFTGQYSSGGAQVAGRSGTDFADFLLGVPQQAALQVAGTTRLRQRSFDLFVEDNWQKNAKLTFNLGLRYEFAMPYVEAGGRMANLDVTPTFSAAAPVVAGGVGPFSGAFPAGLLNTDVNNLGPRLAMAYRLTKGTVLRGGYSITYNSSSYAAIARQLGAEPPFAETETVIGTPTAPLTVAEALLSSTSATTNNFGVDKDYALGMIQTWNAALSRDFKQNWTISGVYTGTKGSDLDILRAPNRGPLGLLIPGVQAFTWESSGGRSILNAASVQLRRRLASGISGAASYTIAKSMDNASSLGAGAPCLVLPSPPVGGE